jgi:hypothetical protein
VQNRITWAEKYSSKPFFLNILFYSVFALNIYNYYYSRLYINYCSVFMGQRKTSV